MKNVSITKLQDCKLTRLRVGFNPVKINFAIIAFTFIYALSGIAHAQQPDKDYLDSLYNRIVNTSAPGNKYDSPFISMNENIKCGFPLRSQIKTNFEYFSPEQQSVLKALLQRPTLDTSIISPSGFFRIHFDTTGISTPNYDALLTPIQNAMQVALAFDSSYNYEVNFLGYPSPPFDNGDGGDNLYDVYITYAEGNYGFTDPETSLGNGKATSHIQIHYDFKSFKTKGIDAVRVTAAHELHHAIQMGNYILRGNDLFFYEITSTSMEEFVFDDVNDYYYYMHGYFNNTSRPFSSFRGNTNDAYDLAVWNIYLADTLGIDIIKRQWELMPQMRALEAINRSFELYGVDFTGMINGFGIWTYFTGHRSIDGKYFKEAANYPLVRPVQRLNNIPPPINSFAPPVSNSFISVVNIVDGFPDSLSILITNADINSGVQVPDSMFPYKYTLYGSGSSDNIKLTENYYYKFEIEKPMFWSTTVMLNNELIAGTQLPFEYEYAYPSPFYNNRHQFLYIPVQVEFFAGTDLNVYTSAMELVYSKSVTPERKSNGQTFVKWQVENNDGKKLATGVYIYAIRSGDNTTKGKILIFNE